MSDFEDDLNDDSRRIERRLVGWSPSAPSLDRDRLLFEAGRAFPRTARISWPMATAALLAIVAAWGWSREHSRRLAAETTLAEARRATPASPVIEPPIMVANREPIRVDPSSYLALSRRLTELANPVEPIPPTVPDDRQPLSQEPILTAHGLRSGLHSIDF